MKESEIMGRNNIFSVTIGEERNQNEFKIHSQSEGRTICEVQGVWDSDSLKIARIIQKMKYSNKDTPTLIKIINRECRHLKLYINYNEFGGIEKIINIGD